MIKTTTRLVQVSVVAKSHDQPAEGLTQDDFKVFVSGNTYTNVLASTGKAGNAVTVVLLDPVNTKLTDRIYAQQQDLEPEAFATQPHSTD